MSVTQAVILTLFAALEIAGLVLAVDAVMRGRTSQGATAWALGLILFPIAAIPLYLVLGERRFAGYVRARRRGTRGIDKVATDLFQNLRPSCRQLQGSYADSRALERLAKMPFTAGNRVSLLIDGPATFEAMFEAIHAARDYLLIQFYIIRDDDLGRRFQKALLNARERGVRVFLIYDEIGSYWLTRAYMEALTRAGCRCGAFRTKRRRQHPFRINFRNHRKILVADGEIAFVGGLNVGDEYLGAAAGLPPWRDTHLALRGPAVQCVQLAFVEDWYWIHRAVPDIGWTPTPIPESDTPVLVIQSGPADDVETCGLFFTHLASIARQRLWIATPYFVPDEQVLGALQLAALRGVDVRVIIPERSDTRLTWLSGFSYYEDLLPQGVRMFRYRPGFMHQKVVLCDELAAVGTANLDNRSFRINFELTVAVADRGFAAEVRAMLENDLTRCREAGKDDFGRMGFLMRAACRTSRLLAPIQ
jgi:cardiolipin synthase A/B